MKKPKLKSMLELQTSVRREWTMNPVTRVQENKKGYNSTRERRNSNQICRKYTD